jgi:hypothetical protein
MGAINKLFLFSLFIPYPAEVINKGHEWNDKVDFEVGPVRLPVKRMFKLASDPNSTQPLQISVTMEFGVPTSTNEVEFALPKNIIQEDVMVDAKTGLPIKRQYAGRLEMEAYTAPGQGRKPALRFSSDLKGSIVITPTK